MRILITGDEGFVGTYFKMKYVDHDITGVDITRGHDARDFFKENDERFDLVIHLAAVVGGRATIEGAPLSVAVDLSIDSELFNWALRTRPGRIVYFSSSAAYPIELQQKGSARRLAENDIDLDNVRSPDYTYGWSKLTGEYLAKFAQAEGLKVNVFRPFSGYGPLQSLDYPFPSFAQRALLRKDPFEIWGDGEQVRDWIHIVDIVDAVDEAIKQDVEGPVNLGWGIPVSFNELAERMTKAAGYSPEIAHLDKPTGVQYRVCDPTKMLSFYTPKIELKQGIMESLHGGQERNPGY